MKSTKSVAYENWLTDVLRSASDLSSGSSELASKIHDWPSYLHLSGERTHLLRPLAGLLRGDILELGADCGALTRYLGENAQSVTALEPDPEKADLTGLRCRDLSNVRVLPIGLNSPKPDPVYDTITCIGSTGAFELNPGLLCELRTMLKPDGCLIIAAENRLGLRNLARDGEDGGHNPKLGRGEWIQRLRESGFPAAEFWYPYPTYQEPHVLVNESGLNRYAGLLATVLAEEARRPKQQPYVDSFEEAAVWPVLGRNGLLGELANSFLIVARPVPTTGCAVPRLLSYQVVDGHMLEHDTHSGSHRRLYAVSAIAS